MGFSAFEERTAGNWAVTFDDGSYPNPQNLNANDVRAIRFDTIVATNDDVIGHDLGVFIDIGYGLIHFAAVNIPALSGQPGVANVDILAAIIPELSPGFWLTPQAVLGLAQYDALGSGKTIRVVAIGGYF